MKYKTFEELKEELGNKFEEYMYKANIELLEKIDKAIEYIKNQEDYFNNYPLIDKKHLLEILGDKDIEFDVLKALNTDLPDDIEMG